MNRPNKLEQLPDEIRHDLHYMIYNGLSARVIKSTLESKWGSRSDIFPISHQSIQTYKIANLEKIKEEVKNDPNIYEQTKKELEGMTEIVKASLEDDGTALSKLKKLENLLLERIEFIREIQDRGLLSPQYETNVSSYSKDLLKVIEALRAYEKETQETRFEDALSEFIPILIRNITNVIFRLQKKFYGDNKRLEFISELENEIPNIIGVSLKEVTGTDPRERGDDITDYKKDVNASAKEVKDQSEEQDKPENK